MKKQILTFTFASWGLFAQQAYPIYGPKAQAVYQPQSLISASSPKNTIRVFKNKKNNDSTSNPTYMPGDGEDYTYVNYLISTDGYKITGTLQGTVLSGSTPGPWIQNASVEGPIYPIPIYTFDANGNYKYLNDLSNEQSFYFNIAPGRAASYYMKVVYRHGYNTINTWQTVDRFPSGVVDNTSYLPGRFINEIRDKAVDQGGIIVTDYILVSDSELPRSYSRAAVHTQFRRNNSLWPDNGNSKLDSVQLFDAVGGTYTQTTLPFELFFANYVKNEDRLNSPIPLVGSFDFGKTMITGSVVISNALVTRYTKEEIRERIVPASWMHDPEGFARKCQQEESSYAISWPSFSGNDLKIATNGGRYFINVKMNLGSF